MKQDATVKHSKMLEMIFIFMMWMAVFGSILLLCFEMYDRHNAIGKIHNNNYEIK